MKGAGGAARGRERAAGAAPRQRRAPAGASGAGRALSEPPSPHRLLHPLENANSQHAGHAGSAAPHYTSRHAPRWGGPSRFLGNRRLAGGEPSAPPTGWAGQSAGFAFPLAGWQPVFGRHWRERTALAAGAGAAGAGLAPPVPGGDWPGAGPVGGCVMTPPADPRREPARGGGGSGGTGSGGGGAAQVGPAGLRRGGR